MSIKLELTKAEAEMLHKVLDCYSSELAIEMARNEIEDFTQVLQQEERTIEKLLQHLRKQGVGILTEDMIGEYA